MALDVMLRLTCAMLCLHVGAENGDFFIQFMDAAEEELRRDVKEVSLPRIQGLLQLALQVRASCSYSCVLIYGIATLP
jgi:hypothetical protein